MVSNDERVKVLKMVAEGKISPEEASELLEALEESSGEKQAAAKGDVAGRRWFRLRVTDTNSGKARVNMRMPLGLVTAGLKLGLKFAPEIDGLSAEEILTAIQSGQMGKILELDDEKDGEHVEVFVD
jgi:DNA-binding transcriptional ArsR family regulator